MLDFSAYALEYNVELLCYKKYPTFAVTFFPQIFHDLTQ